MSGIDWQAMLIGDEPPIFLLEIVIRTFIIYAYTLALLRWLGGRAIGQLSTVEFLLVIALGSAVGDAMFYPDVPLLHAILVITLVVLANKGIDVIMARTRTMQIIFDGKPQEAIRDGVICRTFIERDSFSTAELFQKLREKGVRHVGEVEHAYMESDGVLTVFRREPNDRPGLPVMPPWEVEAPVSLRRKDDAGTLVCRRCGHLSDDASEDHCSRCGHDHWTQPLRTGK
ncbi:Uncharacterized membrane protein YcaP, DUF421 family [Devosia crocina]|uniref:Uncharacterized membrane protein YcaP, DUF421 family n=1 Tax=Devosia crocina TaxID=429728 RepID=A0A1I7NNC6_9HYPH|nr:YetF domain-containing protein [Devosia crocina]SFV36142.1 Uncharacterized membrane protein YcaP, DUF421 family [Devosia crocina]